MNRQSNSVNKDNRKSVTWVEIAVIVIYAVFHVFLCLFHEGCFDEVHAWNIAKDGTLFEIIFQIPNCEGHPSLWHLILVPFAKLGMSYKLAMLVVTSLFSIADVTVFELKAPFPKTIKYLLPFSYFFFYQYGVIARPYCMMLLAFLLVALSYKKRDDKPITYTLSLLFLCATSAFGVAIAGGMALVWLIKIIKPSILIVLRDKRLYCLLVLLIYALFLLFRILPLNPYGGMNYVGVRQNGVLVRSIYLFVGLFSDLFFTNSYTHDFLADFVFDSFEFITACLIGAVILGALIYLGIKIKNIAEFIVPYLVLSAFSVLVYFGVHNSGILFLFLICYLWISWDDIDALLHVSQSQNKAQKPKFNIAVVGVVFLVLPVFWSVSASITDIKYTYSFGEKEAKFLKENGLDDKSICFEWKTVRDESKAGTLEYYDMKHIINMDRLYAYLDTPNFINWPFRYSLYTYFHNTTTDVENAGIIENLKANPKPDVLIGEPDLKLLNGQEYELLDNYIQVYTGKIVKPWKNIIFVDESKIYKKK